jgi:hypothetical protein
MLLTLSRFVGLFRLLRIAGSPGFRGCGLRDRRTWREWVLSLKHRRCNETNKYHRAQQSPHDNDWLPGNQNVHGRPPGDEEPARNYSYYTAKIQTHFFIA